METKDMTSTIAPMNYQEPTVKVVEIEQSAVICTSGEGPGGTVDPWGRG